MAEAQVQSSKFTSNLVRDLPARKTRSLWNNAWHQFRHHRLAMTGMIVLIALFLVTIIGPFIYTKKIGGVNFSAASLPPSLNYPFGTNDLGQDILARVMWGGRISLSVGVISVLASLTLGLSVGAIAGFFGGRIDGTLMRLTDLFLSLPQLPFLLMVIYLFRESVRAIFGPEIGIFVLIVFVIAATTWMPVARVVRALFLSLKEKEFVEAATSVGARTPSIIVRHILPNVLSPVIVAATLGVPTRRSILGATPARLAQLFRDRSPHGNLPRTVYFLDRRLDQLRWRRLARCARPAQSRKSLS